ncbi:MAG: hypothetical protein LBQ33_07465, partial [Oscillospiraceae bacterium]|nr:hypothetical protein [Oscillospiraceae bacterium]
CPTCLRAKAAGGKNLRSRSQALVDDTLLLDFPPDTYWHMAQGGLELPGITALLLTHSHADHLYPPDFWALGQGIAHYGKIGVKRPFPLCVYASAEAVEVIAHNEHTAKLVDSGVMELHIVQPFIPFAAADFTVTALRADHDPTAGPFIYCIARGGKTMLYGNDSGYFPEETWAYLAKAKPCFHFVSLDCTGMIEDYRRYHMGLAANTDVKERLLSLGCATPETIFCAHHFSHNGRLIHDELVPVAAEKGFLASYDGMEIAF